jgi:hypothetical protein
VHRFVRISGNACFAIFHSVVEKHLFTKRMKNETAPLYVSQRNAYVRGVCYGNIAFYMFLPVKIDHAHVRHGDQDHMTIACACAVISAKLPRNRIWEANETLLF